MKLKLKGGTVIDVDLLKYTLCISKIKVGIVCISNDVSPFKPIDAYEDFSFPIQYLEGIEI